MSELLLIDDDESLTELLGSFLSNQGYIVRIAKNGKDGAFKVNDFAGHEGRKRFVFLGTAW